MSDIVTHRAVGGQLKSSVNNFVTDDDRKEPFWYKEPLVHTVLTRDENKHFVQDYKTWVKEKLNG